MKPLSPRTALIVCLISLTLGSLLRLLWPADMEWKRDEQFMQRQALEMARGGKWPAVGMPSGAGGLPNPGLSMWAFGALARIDSSPLGLVTSVMVLNVIALVQFLFWTLRVPPKNERPLWWWSLSFWSLSSLPILFSRKIWAQCLLPVFTVLILWCWAFRSTKRGAFLGGVVLALLGQIHMSGFFFSAGLILSSALQERRRRVRLTRWGAASAGFLLGLLPLLPWLPQIGSGKGMPASAAQYFKNVLSFKFYSHAIGSAWGVNLKDYFQSVFAGELLRWPYVGSVPTWGFLVAHLGLSLLFLVSFAYWWKSRRQRSIEPKGSLASFLLGSVFLGMGPLLTLTGTNVYAHYLIVAFPVLFLVPVLTLRAMPRATAFLLLALGLQCVISLTFLSYVHVNEGVPGADYGDTYRVQVEREQQDDSGKRRSDAER